MRITLGGRSFARIHIVIPAAVSLVAAMAGCIKIGDDTPHVRLVQPSDGSRLLPDVSFASAARLPHELGDSADTSSIAGRLIRAIAVGNDTMVGQLARQALARSKLDGEAMHALADLASADERWGEIPDSPAGDTTGDAALLRAFAGQPAERITMRTREVVVPLARSRSGSPVITVSIGGKPFDFWLDTGAGLTVLSSRTAEALDLAPVAGVVVKGGTSTSRTVGARPVVIPRLVVGGDVRVENHPAVIVDASELELRLFKLIKVVSVDGILGWNFIRKFDVRLDMAAGQARFRLPAPASDTTRNLLWAGYPMVLGSTPAGQPLLLGLDTGANRTWLTAAYLTATGTSATRERSRMTGGAGGFERTRVRVLPETELRVGGVTVAVRDADVAADEKARRLTPITPLHGTIGADVLDLGTVRIDASAGVFAIAPR